ncbi:MAG: hypothetical protein DLM61_02040, partial [Pseudonocardiales bacterium]
MASLVAVAGIVGWRLIEGDSDAAWAAQAQERLGSVDQQLSLLAQTTQQWQTQPAAVIAQRPDVAAILLQREQELARERADLTVGLARYQQLPVMRAREADDDARAQALQWQLDAQAGGGDPAGRDQLAAQLDAVSRPGTPEAGPKCKVSGVDRPSPVDKPSPSQAYSSNACNPGRSVVATNTTRWLGAQD